MSQVSEWFAQGRKLHEAKRFAEAEKLYRQLIEVEPNHSDGWQHLAMVCMAQNKLVEAGQAYQCVLAMSPANVDAMTQLGIVLARQKRLEEAVVKFRGMFR